MFLPPRLVAEPSFEVPARCAGLRRDLESRLHGQQRRRNASSKLEAPIFGRLAGLSNFGPVVDDPSRRHRIATPQAHPGYEVCPPGSRIGAWHEGVQGEAAARRRNRLCGLPARANDTEDFGLGRPCVPSYGSSMVWSPVRRVVDL